MAEIQEPVKIGNYWTNGLDNNTGEAVNFEEVTEWYDGSPMDDSKADGVIYRKLPASVGGGYVKRSYTGPIQSSWIGLDNTGVVDITSVLNSYLLIDDVQLENGVYLGNITVSANHLMGGDNTTIKSAITAIDGSTVTVTNGGKISKISIDGNAIAARGLVVADTAGNFSIQEVSISNLLGRTQQSVGVFVIATTTYKTVDISKLYITNITGEASTGGGSISRGVRVDGNCMVRISDSYFDNVGTFEDGDCIATQTTQDVSGGTGWTPTNVIIDNCEFHNIKKRAIKIQSAGVRVHNCKIYSNYDDFTECPGNAIEIFSSNCIVSNNYIDLKRALTGIRIAGPNNLVENNVIYVDKVGDYRTTGTSLGTTISGILTAVSPANADVPVDNVITDNLVQGSVQAIQHTQASGTLIKGNRCYGGIAVLTSSSNVSIENNTVRKQSFASLVDGITIRDTTTTNIVVKGNTVLNPTFGIRIGQGVSDIPSGWVVKNNTIIGATNGQYRYLVNDVSSDNIFGEGVKDFGESGFVYDSSATISADDLTPSSVAILSTQLTGTPSLAGISFWRIETQRIFPKAGGVEQYIQTAVAVAGTSIADLPAVEFRRIKTSGGYSAWDKIMSNRDVFLATELSISTINISNTPRYRWKTISTDENISVSGASVGGFTTLKVSNTDSSPHTISFTNVSGLTGGVIIPASGYKIISLFGINGSIRGVIEDTRIEASANTATVTDPDAQAVLTELRDLKAKMRTAGILAT